MVSRKLVLFTAVFVLAGAVLWAQESGLEPGQGDGSGTVFQRYPDALGADGNIMTSGGLTWQHWFGRVGVKSTLGGIVQESGGFTYNVQGAFQYMLFGEDFAEWFSGALYTNVLLAHTGEGTNAAPTPSYTPYGHLGLGVGIEMVFLRHLSTSVEFMYVGGIQLAGQITPVVEFSVGGSLKYRF